VIVDPGAAQIVPYLPLGARGARGEQP
jgi:hypothetical protein